MITFAFFQIGDSPSVQLMINSILAFMPSATIIQCSDHDTHKFHGVTDLVQRDIQDKKKIMLERVKAFSELDSNNNIVYIDTDLLFTRAIDQNLTYSSEISLCRRVFYKNNLFNTNLNGINFEEHSGKTMDETYPYLACFTISNSNFWKKIYQIMHTIDTKYHFWYGDQEAIRIFAEHSKVRLNHLLESDYACLPEFVVLNHKPKAIHFKGPARKKLIFEFAKKQGLN